jgi:hypothetical protein
MVEIIDIGIGRRSWSGQVEGEKVAWWEKIFFKAAETPNVGVS